MMNAPALPIPWSSLGPGSRATTSPRLLAMPKGMAPTSRRRCPSRGLSPRTTVRSPRCRPRMARAGWPARRWRPSTSPRCRADRALVNQVLGEGEVAARCRPTRRPLQAQESVFAGLWRVLHLRRHAARPTLEVGAVPRA